MAISLNMLTPSTAAVNISIGTPGQDFTVLVDSMASELLVLSSKCEDAPCPHYRSYNSSASSSHDGDGSRFAAPTFWEAVRGVISKDVVKIGDVHVAGAEFGEAINMPLGWADDMKFEGVLGLAPDATSKSGIRPVVQSLAQSLDLDEAVFAFRFDNSFDRWTSVLTLGGYDETDYDGELLWLPSRRTGLWETAFDALRFGDEELQLDDATVVFSTKWMGLFFPWDMAQLL
jgi:saccharopepsin